MTMLEGGCILYPEQYNYLWKTSWCTLLTSIYAFYRGHYSFSVWTGSVFITSINYWRKPDYSWRRYADMALVKLCLAYNVYYAYNKENRMPYYIIIGTSACFYPLGIYFHKQGKYWHSTYAHSMIHIGANIANFVLCSSKTL